ncbi:DUF2471 family protein [Cupriavidus sp. TMH.W2]|uniref:DUF2471 family protein n=1 Tax=Cupriavidus sp. TMH.W2 TaxID=3434465 RepID=UPI003D782CA5
MHAIFAAEKAIQEKLPAIVNRHRESGHLTWRLLHQIEAEVLAELSSSGRHAPMVISMLRSSELMGYPRDDSPASLEGHDVVPVAFAAIVNAWGTLN